MELLIPALRDHPEPQVPIWLEGLAHATDLMAHTVSQLMSNGVGITARLQVEDLDLPRLAVAAILDNLLSNAVRYSPRNGRIRVRVHGERNGAVVAVRDEGPGLSPTDQARLFQPGARLGATPSEGGSSSGYGLAIAKRFVDQLGGARSGAPARSASAPRSPCGYPTRACGPTRSALVSARSKS